MKVITHQIKQVDVIDISIRVGIVLSRIADKEGCHNIGAGIGG